MSQTFPHSINIGKCWAWTSFCKCWARVQSNFCLRTKVAVWRTKYLDVKNIFHFPWAYFKSIFVWLIFLSYQNEWPDIVRKVFSRVLPQVVHMYWNNQNFGKKKLTWKVFQNISGILYFWFIKPIVKENQLIQVDSSQVLYEKALIWI